MYRLKISSADYISLRKHLLRGRGADEEAAFLLAAQAKHRRGTDLLVREVVPVPPHAILVQHGAGLEIDPVFIATVMKRAKLGRLSIVLCHSHPFSDRGVRFSGIDDGGEELLFPRFLVQVPDVPHGTMVFGHASLDARFWQPGAAGPTPFDEVIVVGRTVDIIAPTSTNYRRTPLDLDDALARQALAIGDRGQQRLGVLKVGFIGAGGLCSVCFDGVARLGVSDIAITDRDEEKLHNVPRQIGGGISDVGQRKVDVLKSAALRLGLGTRVEAVPRWVQEPEASESLKDCDIIVVGTDTMKSRLFASRIGVQYMIPVVSAGIDIVTSAEGRIERIGGHVAVQDPSGPCLDCLGFIDHEMLEAEHETAEARLAHAYARAWDPNAPQPSVVVLNQVVGGAAGVELLQVATGVLPRSETPTYLMYDGCSNEMRRIIAKPIRACRVCDEVRAWGSRFELPIEVRV